MLGAVSSFFGLAPRALNAPEPDESEEEEVEEVKKPGGFSEGDVAGLEGPFWAIRKGVLGRKQHASRYLIDISSYFDRFLWSIGQKRSPEREI